MRPWLRLLTLIAIGALLVGGSRRSEYEIKAALLYKFASSAEWPSGTFAQPDDPLIVAVIGEDPFEDDLEDVLGGKSVGERPLELQRYAELELLRPCHLLFISESETDDIDALLERLSGLPVLLVADDPGLSERGVMLSFLTEGRKVRFLANEDAFAAAGVKLARELLELAVQR